MLVAYLRGLLKPTYENGLRSIIREDIILQAVAAEKEAEWEKVKINFESSLLNKVDPSRVRQLMSSLNNAIRKAKAIGMMDLLLQSVPQAFGSVDSLVEMYKALEKAGIIQNEN
jgi:hypothetical protein